MATNAYLVHDRDSLEPYKRYHQLYGERKYQRVQKPMNSSFLDPPTELRLQIYKYALVLSHPIEFWPETGIASRDIWQGKYDKKRYGSIFNRQNTNLGVLRLCKQVNVEAAEIFYGSNGFRFSGTNGCVVAALFCIQSSLRTRCGSLA